jgi:hypothetical protein
VSAEQQVKPPPKPGAWRRWTARVAVFLLLVGSGLVLLYLGRERWLAPLVVERAARIVREHTGLELTVDRLGGDWWNRLEIEGLSLAGTQPTTELSSLRIDRLELKIDARRLLRGDLTAITSVFADSVQAAVDLSRPLSTVPPGEPSAPAFPWPADLPLIFVGDLGLELELGDGTRGSVQGLSASNVGGQAGAGTEKFALSARHAEFASPSIGTHGAAVDLGVEYRAGLFLLDHVSFDDREVSRAARLDLRDLARGNARFGAVFDGFGGTQEFQGEVASGRLSIFVQTQTLDLAELLALLHVETSLAGRVSLGGVWEAPLDGLCHWRAHASGFADGFVFEGREVDHLEVAGSVDADVLKLREGAAWQGANTLWVEDFAVSLAALSLDELVRSLRGEARVELFLPSAVLGAAPREVLLAAGRVNHASFAVECSPFGFTVHAGEIESDVGGLRVRRGTFDFGALDLPWYRGLLVDLEAELSFEDVAPLFALFGRGDVRGSLSGSAQVSGAALRPTGRFDLAGEGLSIAGYDVGSARIEAEADSRSLQLSRLDLDGGLGRLTARGAFDFGSGLLRELRFTAETRALERLSSGRAAASFTAVDAELNGPWRDPELSANLRAWDLSLSGAASKADGTARILEALEVEGRWQSGCATIASLEARVEEVDVAAAGRVCVDRDGGRYDVRLERAELSRDELDLALEAPLEVSFAPGGFALRDLRVAGSAGRAVGELLWSEAEQRGSIDASELNPMRLLAPFLPEGVVLEGVQGSASFRRAGDEFEAQGKLAIADLRWSPGTAGASLDFEGRLGARELNVQHLSVRSKGHYDLALSGSLPTAPFEGQWLAEGPLALVGEAELTDLGGLPPSAVAALQGWSGAGKASFRLEGLSSDVRGAVEAAVRLVPPADSELFARAGVDFVDLEARAVLGDGLRLDLARVAVGQRASADLTGRIDVALDPRRWLSKGGWIDWRALPVQGQAKLAAEDLGFVAELSPLLRRTGGELRGELALGGTLGRLEPRGALDLARGELRLSNALAPFDRMSARVEVEGTQARIVSLSGEWGAAPFSAQGSVEFASGEPVFDLSVHGDGILLAREEGLRLRADTDLTLRGPVGGLELSGAVTLVEGRFSQDVELVTLPGERPARRRELLELPFLRQAPWSNIEFEVAVRARRPIRVETNVARGTIEPRLVLRGSGAAPRLDGTLLIGPTRVRLPAAVLEVTSGILTFRNETLLVPRLDITAVTRVRGFDITAQVGGTSAEPELLFTSSPPLASEELAVLVLTGQLPESALTAQGSEAAVQTVAVYLGRDLLTRWLGVEGESEDPLSERIEFYRGADVSQTGIESTEFIFRLTPNPKGKRRILYLRAEQDIHEHVNFGLKVLFRFR